ncbi:unnamed protein product [Allacma fusca]|uniref:Beta-hexosaminidase n=1 Tax=Allacma fusca TaxID=39272 RepID=A0A8J2PE94_9HEXA|nr:unnamed protein product [Allacma fusca]
MRNCILVLFGLLEVIYFGDCHHDGLGYKPKLAGPALTATAGQPWPKPQLLKNYNQGYVVVRPTLFRFELVGNNCDMIEDALKRYYSIIDGTVVVKAGPVNKARSNSIHKAKPWKNSTNFRGYLDVLNIHLMGPCETYPHEKMDESYEIKIDSPDIPGKGILVATTNWGLLRGLETFSQLLFPTEDFTSLQLRSTLVVDYPRFPFRSVLLDTSRHYLSKKVILQNLDLMAMNKYNVFHWHIVDDQSFPYQSKTFPELSERGAYHPYTHVYTQKDIADIIEYARVRGIRVVPEFDSPGHTLSWGNGQPDLLTACYKDGKPDGTFGPVDPTQETTYDFLKLFFKEISDVFPDKFIHLGGDEVDFSCWKTNPRIAEFMKEQNFTEYAKVEEYYMQQLVNIVQSFPNNNSYLVWQEVIDNNVTVSKDTIVHVWKGNEISYEAELLNVVKQGYRALLSSCCFPGTLADKQLVLGGGPAMWAEYVDSTNLIPRLWPRAAVPAERLWSNANVNNTHEAAPRLEEHRCRLLKRGFQVEPANGPGYCPVSWD